MRPIKRCSKTRRYQKLKEVDLEADRKILSEIHVKMLVDQNTDVDEEMSYIAEDAVLIPPNGPLIEGKEVFEALIKDLTKTEWDLGKPGRGVRTLEISASGDLAYDIGKYDIVNKTPAGLSGRRVTSSPCTRRSKVNGSLLVRSGTISSQHEIHAHNELRNSIFFIS